MDWLVGTFYLHPINTAFWVIAINTLVAIFVLPKGSRKVVDAASRLGLKQITINRFANYINNTDCLCMLSRLDGSEFNAPVIEGIFSGKRDGLTVTVFSLGLPTGRTGTWQTVVHLRSISPSWLPVFSLMDDVHGKKISDLFRCEHVVVTPLTNPHYLNRHHEAHRIRKILARKPIPDTSIAGMASPLNGVVVDSTGEDFFFYRHGKTAEPFQYGEFIDLVVTLREMIDSGNVNIDVFRLNSQQKATNLYLTAKGVLLISCPAMFAVMLIGYGYVGMSIAFALICLSFFVYAKIRIDRVNADWRN